MSRYELVAAVLILASALFVAAENSKKETDYRANTTEVVDGDTLDINGEIRATVRVLGVDTPETQASNAPDEFGMQDTLQNRECLERWGKTATEFTRNFTDSGEVQVKTDPAADRRGTYGRLLAYIEKDSEDLGAELLERGYARVYESEFQKLEQYRNLENQARSENRGLWQCS